MGVEGGVPVSEDAGSLGLNGIMSGDESAQRATHALRNLSTFGLITIIVLKT